jgi:hypothetical protein
MNVCDIDRRRFARDAEVSGANPKRFARQRPAFRASHTSQRGRFASALADVRDSEQGHFIRH